MPRSIAKSSLLPLIPLLFGLIAPLGCAPTQVSDEERVIDRRHPTYPLIAAAAHDAPHPIPQDTWFDFQSRSPLEFLESMVITESDEPRPPFGFLRSFAEIHRGWVRKSDLPALVARLDDPTPARKFVLMTCSFLPSGHGTTGELAAALIQGYRAELLQTGYGGFPPSLHSGGIESPEAMRAWAVEHMKESPRSQ